MVFPFGVEIRKWRSGRATERKPLPSLRQRAEYRDLRASPSAGKIFFSFISVSYLIYRFSFFLKKATPTARIVASSCKSPCDYIIKVWPKQLIGF